MRRAEIAMKPRLFCRALACVAVATPVLWPCQARAWGAEGHMIVALVAERLLQAHDPAVAKKVAAILATDKDNLWTKTDIAGESVWADALREKSPEGRAATSKWHYIALDAADPDLNRACFGRPALPAMTPASHGPQNACVIDKIKEFARELQAPATSPGERLMALQFLLNLTADLHQPLDVVAHGDEAGECVAVLPPGAKATVRLSTYWNDVLVAESEGTNPTAAADRIVAGLSAADIAGWSRGTLDDWARQTYDVAKSVTYSFLQQATGGAHLFAAPKAQQDDCGPVPVYPLDAAYQQRALAAVKEQLARAGVRLAFLLRENLR